MVMTARPRIGEIRWNPSFRLSEWAYCFIQMNGSAREDRIQVGAQAFDGDQL
jgi:hypothetical protein